MHAIYTGWAKNGLFFESLQLPYMSVYSVLCIKLFNFFIQSNTDVLYVTVFKYSLRNFSVTTLHSRQQLILAMTFIFRLHFISNSQINANIVYVPVEATFSMSIVCHNHYGQYF